MHAFFRHWRLKLNFDTNYTDERTPARQIARRVEYSFTDDKHKGDCADKLIEGIERYNARGWPDQDQGSQSSGSQIPPRSVVVAY